MDLDQFPFEDTLMSTERPIERLAAALQDCFDESVRTGAREAAHEAANEVKAELVPRLDRMDSRLDRMDSRLDRQDAILDKQNETLKLMWKQMKGNGKLPIDD